MSTIPLSEKGADCVVKCLEKDSLRQLLLEEFENTVFPEGGKNLTYKISSPNYTFYTNEIKSKIQELYSEFLSQRSAMIITLSTKGRITGTYFYIPVEHEKFLYIDCNERWDDMVGENDYFESYLQEDIPYVPNTAEGFSIYIYFSPYYLKADGTKTQKLNDCIATTIKYVLDTYGKR